LAFSTASAVALLSLDLNNGAPFLEYEIQFFDLDLRNAVTGIHIHFGHSVSVMDVPALVPRHFDPSASIGRHVLNIYGLPREDDADLMVDHESNRLSGRWDNSDQNLGPNGMPDATDSIAIGAVLDDLLSGDLYFQVHTKVYPAPFTAELRGQILPVPEPSVGILFLVGSGVLFIMRRRLVTGS
jgi:hypothetical protein